MSCKHLNLEIGDTDVQRTCMLKGESVPMNCSCGSYVEKDMSRCYTAIINNCYEINHYGYSNK